MLSLSVVAVFSCLFCEKKKQYKLTPPSLMLEDVYSEISCCGRYNRRFHGQIVQTDSILKSEWALVRKRHKTLTFSDDTLFDIESTYDD